MYVNLKAFCWWEYCEWFHLILSRGNVRFCYLRLIIVMLFTVRSPLVIRCLASAAWHSCRVEVCLFGFCMSSIWKSCVRRLIGSRIIELAAYYNQILMVPLNKNSTQKMLVDWIIRLFLSLLCWPKVILLSGRHRIFFLTQKLVPKKLLLVVLLFAFFYILHIQF